MDEEKMLRLLEMLDRDGEDGIVMIHLDPRVPEARLPPQFVSDPSLRLNVAYGFNLPVFEIDENEVVAALSFGGRDFVCRIPWNAIYGLTFPNDNHKGYLWPEFVPPEVLPHLQGQITMEPLDEPAPKPERPKLRVIPGGKS